VPYDAHLIEAHACRWQLLCHAPMPQADVVGGIDPFLDGMITDRTIDHADCGIDRTPELTLNALLKVTAFLIGVAHADADEADHAVDGCHERLAINCKNEGQTLVRPRHPRTVAPTIDGKWLHRIRTGFARFVGACRTIATACSDQRDQRRGARRPESRNERAMGCTDTHLENGVMVPVPGFPLYQGSGHRSRQDLTPRIRVATLPTDIVGRPRGEGKRQ
jgi:hypothetical protein